VFQGISFVACEYKVEADGDGEQAEIPDHGVVLDDIDDDVFVVDRHISVIPRNSRNQVRARTATPSERFTAEFTVSVIER